MQKVFFSKSFGTVGYAEALEAQHFYHKLCLEGAYDAVFLSLEHKPVITFGKHGSLNDLLVSKNFLSSQGVEMFHSDRGGQVTCHMPGQLVVYPMITLAAFGLGVREYVSLLEDSLLDLLCDYGVKGEVSQKNPGVWVHGKKIASIGVRVKERVTYHGLALNLTNSLELFTWVVPCGLASCEMIRLKDLCSQLPTREVLENQLISRIQGRLLTLRQKKVG